MVAVIAPIIQREEAKTQRGQMICQDFMGFGGRADTLTSALLWQITFHIRKSCKGYHKRSH
jgi:hypothetical protein